MKKEFIIIGLLLFSGGCATAQTHDQKGKPAEKTPYDQKLQKIERYLKKTQILHTNQIFVHSKKQNHQV